MFNGVGFYTKNNTGTVIFKTSEKVGYIIHSNANDEFGRCYGTWEGFNIKLSGYPLTEGQKDFLSKKIHEKSSVPDLDIDVAIYQKNIPSKDVSFILNKQIDIYYMQGQFISNGKKGYRLSSIIAYEKITDTEINLTNSRGTFQLKVENSDEIIKKLTEENIVY